MRRADNGGLCDPESCPEYQDRKCNLSGRFIFFIPGIKSISAFELPTNSFYAMNAAIQKFQTIGFMRGGRISGFLDSKQHTVLHHQAAGRGAADRRRGPARAHSAVADRTRGAGRRHGAVAARRGSGRRRGACREAVSVLEGRSDGTKLRRGPTHRRRWRDPGTRLQREIASVTGDRAPGAAPTPPAPARHRHGAHGPNAQRDLHGKAPDDAAPGRSRPPRRLASRPSDSSATPRSAGAAAGS